MSEYIVEDCYEKREVYIKKYIINDVLKNTTRNTNKSRRYLVNKILRLLIEVPQHLITDEIRNNVDVKLGGVVVVSKKIPLRFQLNKVLTELKYSDIAEYFPISHYKKINEYNKIWNSF
jgi:hypothetical protein